MQRLARGGTGLPAATIVSSDLLRASSTAALLSESLGIRSEDIVTEPRLREMHFGVWDGQRWDDIYAQDAAGINAWMAAWTEHSTPEGEGFPQLYARVVAWVTTLTSPTPDVIVVAHAGSIRALLVNLLGITVAQAFQMRLDHAHVTAIAHRSHGDAHGAELLYLNAARFQPLGG